MRRLITLVALAVALPVAALGAVGLFGCATPQEPLRSSAPLKEGGRSDFLRCVAAEVTDRGYTITSSDAEIGVLKAERVTPETFTAVGQTDFIEAAAPGKTATATVTAYTDATVTQLNGQNRANREVSDEAKADAAAVKSACLDSLAISPEQPPAPPAATAPATSPEGAATPEASTEAPPAADDR